MWTVEGGGPTYRTITACYDPVSGSVFAGQLDKPGIRRYAGPAFDLRDDPTRLYATTPDAANDDTTGYHLRVVPTNSSDLEPGLAANKGAWYSLDNRTVCVDQDPRHTSHDLGGIVGSSASAQLESGSLALDSTDLAIASFGPEAALSRSYDSTDTSSGYSSPGWRFNFEQTLSPADPDAERVVFTDEAGEAHVFAKHEGEWLAANGFTGRIEHHPNLPIITTDDTWTITFKDLSVTTFDDEGGLLSEADGNGNTVTYDVDDDHVRMHRRERAVHRGRRGGRQDHHGLLSRGHEHAPGGLLARRERT